jgi:hypothetical protein
MILGAGSHQTITTTSGMPVLSRKNEICVQLFLKARRAACQT